MPGMVDASEDSDSSLESTKQQELASDEHMPELIDASDSRSKFDDWDRNCTTLQPDGPKLFTYEGFGMEMTPKQLLVICLQVTRRLSNCLFFCRSHWTGCKATYKLDRATGQGTQLIRNGEPIHPRDTMSTSITYHNYHIVDQVKCLPQMMPYASEKKGQCQHILLTAKFIVLG